MNCVISGYPRGHRRRDRRTERTAVALERRPQPIRHDEDAESDGSSATKRFVGCQQNTASLFVLLIFRENGKEHFRNEAWLMYNDAWLKCGDESGAVHMSRNALYQSGSSTLPVSLPETARRSCLTPVSFQSRCIGRNRATQCWRMLGDVRLKIQFDKRGGGFSSADCGVPTMDQRMTNPGGLTRSTISARPRGAPWRWLYSPRH